MPPKKPIAFSQELFFEWFKNASPEQIKSANEARTLKVKEEIRARMEPNILKLAGRLEDAVHTFQEIRKDDPEMDIWADPRFGQSLTALELSSGKAKVPGKPTSVSADEEMKISAAIVEVLKGSSPLTAKQIQGKIVLLPQGKKYDGRVIGRIGRKHSGIVTAENAEKSEIFSLQK